MAARALFIALTTAALGSALVAPPARAVRPPRAAPLSMSWQPNTDFNGESSGRLTDFERSARDAGVGDRKVTIRKPLGLVLDANAQGDVYVKEVVRGGNAEAIGGVNVGDTVAEFANR